MPLRNFLKAVLSKWKLLVGLSFVLILVDIACYYQKCQHFSSLAILSIENRVEKLASENKKQDAIVVLAGDSYRISEALALLRYQGSPLLVISGAGRGIPLTDLINQQGSAAVDIHQTWSKIKVESRSGSTVENAMESFRLLVDHSFERIILVTSDYHMHRALRIFSDAFEQKKLEPFPVISQFTYLGLSLSANNRAGLWKFFMEYLKYRLYCAYILPHP